MTRRSKILNTLLCLGLLPALAWSNASNPGATHTLLLDFGEFSSSADWPYREGMAMGGGGGGRTSPALFPQNAPENFSQAQQDEFVFKVFRRVAEDYAPFDVNVVTVAPANFDQLMANRKLPRQEDSS